MPSIVNHLACPSCGTEHHFCDLFTRIVPGTTYEYVCPVSGKWSSIMPAEGGEDVAHSPQGGVQFGPKLWAQAA